MTTPVGNVGINRFKATFTPADTDHYNSVKDIEIDINVTKINESSVESVNGGDPLGINQTVRNKLFDVKIKLPFPVERFIVFNENGKGIPNSIVSSENCEDGRILYAIRLSIGTKGKRTLALYAKVDGKTVSLGLSFDITVNEIKADQTVQKRLLDVQVDVTPCKRNVPFIVTVKTTSAVQRVGIFNQNGAGVSKKLISATTENNVTTTVYSVSVGSKGTRVFFVRMAQDDGTWSDDSISFTKTIEK